LIAFPLVIDYKILYTEITNYEVSKTEHALILDLTKSPEKPKYDDLIKFDSHEIVECYNDSTKFFMKKEKSFYGVTVTSKVVWSKPPYKYYYGNE
jgi:hypothetical protein